MQRGNFFMPNQRVQRVVFQPESYQGMQRGINQMANAVRPTLGPLARNVAVAHPLAHRTPELLDNGAVISKRLIQLPDRDEDMGAMFLRHVLQHVYNKTGDGTATAAVILQSVYNQGIRYLAAGGNPMILRRYLETGTRAILTTLNAMTTHIRGEKKLARVADTICHDKPLAELIGEIFSIIGEHGRLEIKAGNTRELHREYVEGLYWDSELMSRELMTAPLELKGEVENAAILMTNLTITDPMQLVPALEAARGADLSGLAVIALSLSPEAVAMLAANSKANGFRAIAAKVPGMGHTKQTAALNDMTILAGGQLFVKQMGKEDLSKVTLQDLGRARKVWANLKHVGIVGGKGDPRHLRRHIAELRSTYQRTSNREERQDLQERLGKLISGSATLTVGGGTTAEILARKEVAVQTCDAMRGVIMDGVLPGGGIAYLDCQPVLREKLDQATSPDERAAYNILIKALAEPLRTIFCNAGLDPGEIMGQINHAGPGHGFDIHSGQVVNMTEAGIFDSASVLKTAVQSAVASAALALTTEVLVHHKKPSAPVEAGPGAI